MFRFTSVRCTSWTVSHLCWRWHTCWAGNPWKHTLQWGYMCLKMVAQWGCMMEAIWGVLPGECCMLLTLRRATEQRCAIWATHWKHINLLSSAVISEETTATNSNSCTLIHIRLNIASHCQNILDRKALEVEVNCGRCRSVVVISIPVTVQITYQKIIQHPKSTAEPDLIWLIVNISFYHKLNWLYRLYIMMKEGHMLFAKLPVTLWWWLNLVKK